MCTFICAGILVQAPFASAFGFFFAGGRGVCITSGLQSVVI